MATDTGMKVGPALFKMLANEAAMVKIVPDLKRLLPETWTRTENWIASPNHLRILFQFKLLGLDWRSNEDFGAIMVALEKFGIMQRDGLLIRANPNESKLEQRFKAQLPSVICLGYSP